MHHRDLHGLEHVRSGLGQGDRGDCWLLRGTGRLRNVDGNYEGPPSLHRWLVLGYVQSLNDFAGSGCNFSLEKVGQGEFGWLAAACPAQGLQADAGAARVVCIDQGLEWSLERQVDRC